MTPLKEASADGSKRGPISLRDWGVARIVNGTFCQMSSAVCPERHWWR